MTTRKSTTKKKKLKGSAAVVAHALRTKYVPWLKCSSCENIVVERLNYDSYARIGVVLLPKGKFTMISDAPHGDLKDCNGDWLSIAVSVAYKLIALKVITSDDYERFDDEWRAHRTAKERERRIVALRAEACFLGFTVEPMKGAEVPPISRRSSRRSRRAAP